MFCIRKNNFFSIAKIIYILSQPCNMAAVQNLYRHLQLPYRNNKLFHWNNRSPILIFCRLFSVKFFPESYVPSMTSPRNQKSSKPGLTSFFLKQFYLQGPTLTLLTVLILYLYLHLQYTCYSLYLHYLQYKLLYGTNKHLMTVPQGNSH